MSDAPMIGSDLGRAFVNQTRSVLMFIGITSVILGAVVLIWPSRTILVLAYLTAVWLIMSGLFQIVQAIFVPADGGTKALTALSGIAGLILGIMAFRYSSQVEILALLIGIGWLLYGVVALISGIAAAGVPGRVWLITAGLLMIVGGIVLLAWPNISLLILAVITGSWLVAFGVVQILHAFQLRKVLA